jgi:phosphoglycolate phosphatase
LAIVSNKLQSGVDELYKQYFVDNIQVAIGERAGLSRKPAPDMVLMVLDELGVNKNETLYVGDSEVDVATAKASGISCVSVLWGFRDKEFLEQHGAEYFIKTPMELLTLLEE